MTANLKKISLQLIAAVSNGIATSQTLGAAGNLTINGSLASGGVATFDVARRVGITSAGNDSALIWTVSGTDRYGRSLSETIAGSNVGTSQTINDFLTVTKISGSAATASTVTAGTTSVASSAPYVIDYFINPAIYRASVTQVGTANWTIEESVSDIWPNMDVVQNPPNWFSETLFTAASASTHGTLTGPLTLVRLTINSGTGLVTAEIATPFVAGGA